jgi:hypothetical protein
VTLLTRLLPHIPLRHLDAGHMDDPAPSSRCGWPRHRPWSMVPGAGFCRDGSSVAMSARSPIFRGDRGASSWTCRCSWCASGSHPQLAPWLARAADSPLVPLQRLAKGLRDDDDAVQAGVPLPWSHGPVEGHRHRVKTLTRPLCGRASRELRQRRFVLAA